MNGENMGMKLYDYAMAVISTLGAWFVGLLLDANLDFYPQGFLCLRILFPFFAMGLCILKTIRNHNKSE